MMMVARCGDVVNWRDSGRWCIVGVDRGDRARRAVHVAVRKDHPVCCGNVPDSRPYPEAQPFATTEHLQVFVQSLRLWRGGDGL